MFAYIKYTITRSILILYGISLLSLFFLGRDANAYYEVTNTLSVGDNPTKMLSYNNKVYVANINSDNVSVIDGTTNTISTITVGAEPSGLLLYNNRIYVTNYVSCNMSIINPNTNTVIGTINLDCDPGKMVAVNNKIYIGIDIAGSSDEIYVFNTIDSSISIISAGTEVDQMIAINDKIYISHNSVSQITIINSIDNSFSSIPMTSGGCGFVNRNTILYVRMCGSNNVSIIDTITNTVTGNIPVSNGIADMTILGNNLYIANSLSNTVSIIDVVNGVQNEVAVGDSPISFTTLNNNVYVANRDSDNLSIINGLDNSVSTLTVGDSPENLTSLNNKIYVANNLSDTVSIISNIPTITYPTNNDILTTNIITFTGVAESGSTVSLLNIVGNTLTTTIANSNNTFVANYIATGPGSYTARPRSVFNGLVNTGSIIGFSILGGQITAPSNNTITSNASLVFSGIATSGASVNILLNGVSIGISTGDSNNVFSYNPGISYPLGSYTLQPIFTLSGATVTGSTTTFTIVEPLSVPLITSFTNNSIFTTNTINFSGTVSSGANVNILLNGISIGNTTGTTGNVFNYTINNLGSGNYAVQPIATLNGMIQTGNLLNFAVSPSIIIPSITSFINNALFNNNIVNISGSATSGSTVTLLLNNNTILGTTLANSGNTFSYTFSNITNGAYTIQPIATLGWMIQTGATLNFTYVGNSGITPPVITSPNNNTNTNGTVTFYGNGTPGYNVSIINQFGDTIINGVVGSLGTFSLGPISIPSGTYTVRTTTGGNNTFGNSITITTSYNNNNNYVSSDYCPGGDYTSSIYDGLCGESQNNSNIQLPQIDSLTATYDDEDYDINTDVLEELCIPYEDDGYSNTLYESLKIYKKEIFVICWMKSNGLTKHTKTGYFRGTDGLRRDESAKFIYNFLTEILNITTIQKNTFCNYKDLYKYNNDLKNYIKKSCEAGLYKGTQSNSNFNPSYFLKTNYFYSIVSNMIKVYQPNGDADVSILDDISEINKNSTTKMTRLKAAHALYKLSQILYSPTN